MTHKQPSGFTLIEMVVAMAVIAILAVAIIPPAMGWLNEHGLSAAVDQIRGDLQTARMAAINRRQNITVNFANTGDPATSNYTVPALGRTVQLSTFRGQVRLLANGPDGVAASGAITFNRRGLANASQVFLTNATGQTIFRVRLSSSGGTSVHTWNAAGLNWRPY